MKSSPVWSPTILLTITLIKMYMIAPKKGTPKLSGFLKNNHQSLACTTHNEVQHGVYTKKDVQNNVQLQGQDLNKIPGLGT